MCIALSVLLLACERMCPFIRQPVFTLQLNIQLLQLLVPLDIQIYSTTYMYTQIQFLLLNRQRCIYIDLCAVLQKVHTLTKIKATMIFRNGKVVHAHCTTVKSGK